ncbi:MAG: MoxR family ATPase [Phycisphaerae bacterium]|jgi:MoxR-like ATPase|nr:MoxR family ATPase [Phycisphaerae bacterium]
MPTDPEANTDAAAVIRDDDDVKAIEVLKKAYGRMTDELSRVVVGQSAVIEQVLIAIFCRGHSLLVGVPGLAKTLLVSTLADVLQLGFKRIQFTPDLMPSDITGTDVLEEDHTTGKRIFRFVHGPLFTNMVLADEINRTPPKTQAALLEAMQERQVTVGEKTYPLPDPFFVLATQNPIEQEGTYPLPEAQLDRFMFNIMVDYPTSKEELAIMKQVTGTYSADLTPTLTGDDIIRLQGIVRRVPVAEHVFVYARDLARATRPNSIEAPRFINELVGWGAGPRAGIYMVLAAKARAILYGRSHTTTEDVRQVALPVLRHRVLTTFNAEAAGVTSDDVVRRLLEEIKPDVKGIE